MNTKEAYMCDNDKNYLANEFLISTYSLISLRSESITVTIPLSNSMSIRMK